MADLQELQSLLDSAAEGLPKVTSRKMFGCHALFADDNVFGLVWKHGRIGVKLPDEETYEKLMAKDGAAPWKAGAMTMAHWVLVPESLHGRAAELKKWVATAHEQCRKLEKKPAKKGKKAAKPKAR